MDNKITYQELSETLAKRNGIKLANAERFSKTIFEIIEEKIVSEGLVKIKGLGTFKLIEVLPRESVDVSTGARILIPGHTKITFTPDCALREQVNKPFADFQTVIINEDTNIEEMERIEGVQCELIEEVSGSKKSETENVNIDSECEIKSESEIQESAVAHESELSVPSATNADILEVNEFSYSVPDTKDSIDEETEPLQEIILDGEEDRPDSEPSEVPETTSEVEVYIEPFVVASEIETEDAENKLLPDVIQDQERADEKVQGSEVVEPRPVQVDQNKVQTNIWMHLFYILLMLVLMSVSYILGYYKVLCPCEKENINIESTESVKKDSVINSAKIIKQERPEDLYPQVPGGKYLIIGVKKTREMKVGDNLFKIAREEYGDKEFAQYIIVLNQFVNPDVISKGYPIKLPELQEVK